MEMVRPPGIVVIAPRIGAGLDRGEPIPPLIVGKDSALAAEVRIDRRVMLVRRVLIAAGGIGLPDLDYRARDRPAILVGDAALHDDALAERRFPIDDRQIGDRREMRGAEERPGGLGNRVGQPHQAFLRVPFVGAAVAEGVIGWLRPRRIRAEGQWITVALHSLSSLASCLYGRFAPLPQR